MAQMVTVPGTSLGMHHVQVGFRFRHKLAVVTGLSFREVGIHDHPPEILERENVP
jgi:hypothetical protein